MFDWKCEPVINSSYRYACFLCFDFVRSLARFDIVDQPVVVASVCVPDDVVQHHQLLELELKTGGGLTVQRLRLELPQMEVGVFVVLHETLEGTNLGRQSQSVELPTNLGEMFVDNFLGFGFLPVDPQIVEGLRGQLDNFGVRNNFEPQLLVHQTGSGLGHVALVGDQTGPPEAAGTTDPVHPFGPLGV